MGKHIILIHGAWHGSWCWDEVKKELIKEGYTVEAPTMPGHMPEDDRANISFSDYINAITEILQRQKKPVVLVGHSSAGFLLQSVAAKIPEQIEHLVFNNAFILPDGKCQFDVVPPDVAEGMTNAANASPDNCVPVMEDFVRNALMAGEIKDKQDFLINKLVPQPLSLFTTPVDTKGYNGSNFQTTVLYSNKDASLPDGAYLGMAQALGEFNLIEMPLGHEGMYTDPELYAKCLIEAISK